MTSAPQTAEHCHWMVLPDGYADREATIARLSLVASPRVITASGKLDDATLVADWPSQIGQLGALKVRTQGSTELIPATIVGPPPRTDLWQALFRPQTPVDLAGGGTEEMFDHIDNTVLYAPVVRTLRRVYQEAITDGAARATGVAPGPRAAARVLTGLTQWTQLAGAERRSVVAGQLEELLDPSALTTARAEQAAELLRGAGMAEAAEALPLVGVLMRMRAVGPRVNGNPPPPSGNPPPPIPSPQEDGPAPAGPIAGIRPVDLADFHQVMGLVSAHPTLARALGLRVDLTIPAFSGERSIRITGLPLQVTGGAPWSRVVSDRDNGRFVMATEPGAPTEILHGMLDMRAEGPGADKYVVTTADVYGTTQQLAQIAGRAADASDPDAQEAPSALPARRNAGFTVAQVDRVTGVLRHALERSRQFSAALGVPTPINDAADAADADLTLYADDVTAGYRVDVRVNAGPWLSLMRRTVRYAIGPGGAHVLTADDEGSVVGSVAIVQPDGHGSTTMAAGEEIFGWDGFSLAVRRPGPALVTDNPGGPTTGDVEQIPIPGYDLVTEVKVKPGTLPRLRYGRQYQFRARTVDPAGNSIAPDRSDPALVSPVVTYRRVEPVLSPTLVPRRAFSAGESLLRLVVRGDGDGNLLGGPCERHLAAPRAAQHQAELHGLFDAAFGADDTGLARARDRALAIGAIEAGAFTDPRVPDPTDPTRLIQATGLAVVVNQDSTQPVTATLPVPRGQALPAGEYVVIDADEPNLPYLPDPLARGVALFGTLTGAVRQVAYAGGGWPDVRPSRLVLRAGTTGPGGAAGHTGPVVVATPASTGGRTRLEVTVPPASTVAVTLSSALSPEGLSVLDADLPPELRKAALAGQVPELTPGQRVYLVHAVRRPIAPPSLGPVTLAQPRPRGATTAAFSGQVNAHSASTAQVDVEAHWTEVVDDGRSPVRTEQRTASIGSVPVAWVPFETSTRSWTGSHQFGDTKRRNITLRPVATTRFREYFPEDTDRTSMVRAGADLAPIIVRNTSRPDRPDVHSVVPIFRWTRTQNGTKYTSVRETVGVRVHLKRPWCTTGTDERLAVIVYGSQQSGDQAENTSLPVRGKVSRWGTDPLVEWMSGQKHLTLPDFPASVSFAANIEPTGLLAASLHPVTYDETRGVWSADVEVKVSSSPTFMPFLRLAVARYQPESVSDCFMSPIVLTEPVQLPAKRTLTVTATGPDQVTFEMAGPGSSINPTFFEAAVHTRAPDPLAGSDVVTSAPARTTVLSSPTPGPVTGLIRTVGADGQPAKDLLAGRIVVREYQNGLSLHRPPDVAATPTDPGRRVIYLDAIDRAQLGNLGPFGP